LHGDGGAIRLSVSAVAEAVVDADILGKLFDFLAAFEGALFSDAAIEVNCGGL